MAYHDMEALDPDYYRSLVWIMENEITDMLDLTFAADVDKFGVVTEVERQAQPT